MVDNRYIVLLYYDYNHSTDIIENDKKLNKLINLSIYESVSKFFSQLDSRRYYCVVIDSPFIYKLIKLLVYPYTIDTIFKFIPCFNELLISSLTDSQGFLKAPFDSVKEENYQLSKYEDYIMKESYFIQYLDNVKLHEDDLIVRIYGNYDDTIPINFLLFEDLSINISLKCK
jgi:hypothetical protein